MDPTINDLPPGFEPFVKSLRHGRIAMLILGPFVMAVPGLVWILAPMPEGGGEWAGAIAISVFMGGVGLMLLWLGLKDPMKAPFLEVIRYRIHDVVWIYTVHTRRNGQHVGTAVVLGLVDGKQVRAGVPIREEAQGVAALRQLAPAAVFGYSPELEARFKADPRSFRV